MVKRISIIIIVSVILVTGYISFRKLNYWDRSVMIFKFDSSEQAFRGRGGRGPGGYEGRETGRGRAEFREGAPRPDRMIVPDSLRRRPGGREQPNFDRRRAGPDNLAATRITRDSTFSSRGEFDGRMRGRDRNEGRDFRRGKTVNLNLVTYYLAVFALFTLIIIYIEKICRMVFRKKT